MPRALVVDDDPQIQKVLKRILERLGFEVTQCEYARCRLHELLQHERGNPFRYVFLDYNFVDPTDFVKSVHGETGEWLAKRIAVVARDPDPPIPPVDLSATFVLHSSDPDGAARMAAILKSAGLRVRVIPKHRLEDILMYYKPAKSVAK